MSLLLPKTSVRALLTVALLFALPLVRSFAETASPAERLSALIASSNAELAKHKIEHFSPERWNRIAIAVHKLFVDDFQGRFDDEYAARRDMRRAMRELMLERVANLLSPDRVGILTPELRAAWGLDKEVKSGAELQALYFPLTHWIFVADHPSDDEVARRLTHELLHAYQTIYRTPVDIPTLLSLEKELEWPRDQLLDFQSFFYELQANWYVERLAPESEWYEFMQTHHSGYRKTRQALSAVTAIPMHLFTLGFGAAYARKSINKELAIVDRLDAPNGGLEFTEPRGNAFRLMEPLCPSGKGSLITLGEKLDWGGLKAYCQAVEHTYYGKLQFLFADGRPDSRAILKFHDAYYEHIGLRWDWGARAEDLQRAFATPECQDLLFRVRWTGSSPLAQWLLLPIERIQACPAFGKVLKEEDRQAYIELILNPEMSKTSPFRFRSFEGGTEGTRPDLRVLPGATRFLPQLKVRPEQ